jgi:predicted aconitase
MKNNLHIITSELDFSIEEAKGIVEILKDAGVGTIEVITMETPSDKWDYSFMLTNSKETSFYVAMDIAGYVSLVKKGGKDGEVVYCDSINSEEN